VPHIARIIPPLDYQTDANGVAAKDGFEPKHDGFGKRTTMIMALLLPAFAPDFANAPEILSA
jgi:hypothetical protein